jgi:hypothetical protein
VSNTPRKSDWRIQAETTLMSDLPAAFAGGPSHKAGATVTLVTQVEIKGAQPIVFNTPSTAALAFSIAAKEAHAAAALRSALAFRDVTAPGGSVRLLTTETTAHLFDFFERCLVATVFSIQALEAYANYKISQAMKVDVLVTRKGKQVALSPVEAERQLSTDDKLGFLLPTVLSVQSPKGKRVWEEYVALRRRRDETIHFKSQNQWNLADRDFTDSPYAWFINNDVRTIPIAALAMFRYFATDAEQEWANGADAIVQIPASDPGQSSEPQLT